MLLRKRTRLIVVLSSLLSFFLSLFVRSATNGGLELTGEIKSRTLYTLSQPGAPRLTIF